MGFGYGPGNEMQRSVKNNRALLGTRKSLKELQRENGSFSSGKLKFKNATEEELEALKTKLKSQKRKEIIQLVVIFSMSVGIGVFLWYLLTVKKF